MSSLLRTIRRANDRLRRSGDASGASQANKSPRRKRTKGGRKADTYRAARRAEAIKSAAADRAVARAAAIQARAGYMPRPEQGPNGQQLAANRRLNQSALALYRKAA